MRTLTLSLQMTLDGYISGPNGTMDWIRSDDEEWSVMMQDLQSVDTVLIGRNMYPGYTAYWHAMLTDPNADKNLKNYAAWADRTPHIVFSRTISKSDWKNTRISHDAVTELKSLKQQPGGEIYMWGGATLASELINHNLVDALRITINPMLMGSGLWLFRDMKARHSLSLISSRQFKSGLILLKYRFVK